MIYYNYSKEQNRVLKTKGIDVMKKNIITYYSEQDKPEKLPEYTIEDVNSEKAMKLYNYLKELGWNVQIELFWGYDGKGICLSLGVYDYSHHDGEGNEYCYSFNPITGEEISE
jgi:hypothetical protein